LQTVADARHIDDSAFAEALRQSCAVFQQEFHSTVEPSVGQKLG